MWIPDEYTLTTKQQNYIRIVVNFVVFSFNGMGIHVFKVNFERHFVYCTKQTVRYQYYIAYIQIESSITLVANYNNIVVNKNR